MGIAELSGLSKQGVPAAVAEIDTVGSRAVCGAPAYPCTGRGVIGAGVTTAGSPVSAAAASADTSAKSYSDANAVSDIEDISMTADMIKASSLSL